MEPEHRWHNLNHECHLSLTRNGLDLDCHVVDASRVMLILSTGKTTAERAAIAVARRYSIPCAVRQPQCSGHDRRSYRDCLKHNAAAADGTLVLSDASPSYSANVRLVLEANKPVSAVAVRVALQFPDGAASTRRWLHKRRIQRLHVTGTAPKAVAAEFLRELLKR